MLGIGSYAFRWNIGIRDRVPERPMTAAQVLEHAHGLGVSLVQFADNLLLHTLPDAEVDALGQQARQLGMTLELGMTGCDPALVDRYLDIAGRLDVHLLRIAPTAEESAGSDAEIVALFARLLDSCKAAGVVLAVENHFHLPSPRLVNIVTALADPALGVCLDVANSIACQEWPAETIALLAPFAVNLHLKDYRIAIDPHGVGCTVVGTPLGQGVFDPATVFAALAQHGRSVNTILEHWLPWQGTFEASRDLELDWLRQSVAAAQSLASSHPAINAAPH